MTQLAAQRKLSSTPQAAFDIVVDVECFPDFMENIVSIDVLEESETRKLVAWKMTIDEAEIEWTEEVLYDHENLRATFTSISGMFERFDGVWQVTALPTGADVELRLDYELGLPEIEHIIGGILKQRLTRNIEAMLASLEARAR